MNRRSVLFTALFCLLIFSCKGPTGPQGEGEQSLTDPGVMPEILTTYPLNRSAGPYTDYNNRITIRFNKIMDRTSVKRGIHLTSPMGDVQVDTTSVSVTNTDIFTIAPLDVRGSSYKFYWKIGAVYSVVIDTSAFDVNGNHLHAPARMSFTPEPYFRIATISPANGATEIATSSTITLTFNSPVDTSVFSHLVISPSLTGHWAYIPVFPAPDSAQLRFAFQGAGLDSAYTVTMDTTAHDKFGQHANSAFHAVFTTSTFRVTATAPVNGTTGVSPFNPIRISFTAPIDTASFRASFSISPSTPGYFQYSPTASPTFAYFYPSQRLAMNSTYNLSISDSMKSVTGVHLAQPYSWYFSTPAFQVSSTNPTNGATGLSVLQPIHFTFSDILDTSTIRSSVIISPSVPLQFILSDSSTSFYFRPTAQFAENTSYIVILTGGIHSTRGDSLALAYSLSFTTVGFGIQQAYPGNNETNVDLRQNISFSFTAPLDTSTVGSAFSVSPPVNGSLTYSYDLTGFTFIPSGLASATNYTVTLSTALRSTDSSRLGTAYQSSFTTAKFHIIYSNPNDGEINVSPTAYNHNIMVAFNGPIDTAGIDTSVTISPSVNGYVSMYEGSNSLNYTVSDPSYRPNTTYHVKLSKSIRTVGGGSLAQPYQFSFSTEPFSIYLYRPINGSVGVGRYTAIAFYSDSYIDTASARAAFTISPFVPGTWGVSYSPANEIDYYPFALLDSMTTYTVGFSTALKSIFGDSIAAPYSASFKTGP